MAIADVGTGIPLLSSWGAFDLMLLLLVVGIIVVARRRPVAGTEPFVDRVGH